MLFSPANLAPHLFAVSTLGCIRVLVAAALRVVIAYVIIVCLFFFCFINTYRLRLALIMSVSILFA